MFEIKHRDAMGRIGKLKINGKTIETPTIMPVVHPNPKKQTVSIEKIEKLADVIITNSYIINSNPELKKIAEEKGIHNLIGFDKVIVTDSGSFQLSVYGEVLVEPEEIIEFQEKIGVDVGTILDIPTAPYVSREQAEEELKETLRRAELSVNLKNEKNYKLLLNGTIQGSTYLDLRQESAKKMKELDFDIYPIGAVVPLMENYDYAKVVEIILNSKKELPTNKPVHLFGCGHPMMFALSVALGCDLFDSAAYALYAKDGRYLTESGTLHLEDLKDLEKFPCSCPVCIEYTPKELTKMDKRKRTELLAEHNLYITFEEINRIKQSIKDGNLWELVEERCRAHPKLLEAYRKALEYNEFIEEFDPITKKSAFFYGGYESLYRPEIIRHKKRLKRIKSDHMFITTVSNDINRPYSENTNMMDSDVLVLIKDDLFGLVPLSIDTVYPLSQCDNPKLYPYEKIHNNEFIEEFIQNNKDKIMDITTYNYYTNHYTSNANKNKVSSDAIRINNMIQYQYGFKLNNDELQKLIIKRSKKTNRIRNVLIPTDGNNKEVLFTLRSNDNLLIPAKEGAKLIHEKLPFPKYRVVIDSEVEEFARDGKSVFSKFVINCDKELRPYEEVIIVNENDELLAYGTTLLNGKELEEFNYGVAVSVRSGFK